MSVVRKTGLEIPIPYKVYAGNQLFSYHEDVYNLKHSIDVIKEWHQHDRASS